MKAFVIASHENKTLATRLLKNSNVDELTFSDPQTGHFLGTSNLVRKSILQSSVIVVLIDQNTNSSSSMKEELKFADEYDFILLNEDGKAEEVADAFELIALDKEDQICDRHSAVEHYFE